MQEGQTCGTCSYFKKVNPQGGECRYNPPQMVALQTGTAPAHDGRGNIAMQPVYQVRGHWPMMSNSDIGCGQYLRNRSEVSSDED